MREISSATMHDRTMPEGIAQAGGLDNENVRVLFGWGMRLIQGSTARHAKTKTLTVEGVECPRCHWRWERKPRKRVLVRAPRCPRCWAPLKFGP